MKLDSSSQNLDSLIEQYNRELMRFYQQNAPRIQRTANPSRSRKARYASPIRPKSFRRPIRRISRRITGGRCASVWNKKARHPCPTRPKATRQRPHSLFHRAGRPVSKSFPIHLEDRILEEGLLPAYRWSRSQGRSKNRCPRKTASRRHNRFSRRRPRNLPRRKAPPSCRKSCLFPCLQDTYRCFYPPQGRPRRFRAPS